MYNSREKQNEIRAKREEKAQRTGSTSKHVIERTDRPSDWMVSGAVDDRDGRRKNM